MRKSKRWLSACLLTLILCLGVFCTPAMADNSTPEPTQTPQPENGVEVTVSEDGTYTVSLGDWEWTFRVEDLAEARIGTVVNVHSYLNVRTGAGLENTLPFLLSSVMNCFPALVLLPISSISVRLPSGVSASLCRLPRRTEPTKQTLPLCIPACTPHCRLHQKQVHAVQN